MEGRGLRARAEQEERRRPLSPLKTSTGLNRTRIRPCLRGRSKDRADLQARDGIAGPEALIH